MPRRTRSPYRPRGYKPPPKTPAIVSQPPTPEIAPIEITRARRAGSWAAEQRAKAPGPYSLPTAWGVSQIPTGLQQAGYVPGAYVSTAKQPFRGVYGAGTAGQLAEMYPGEAFMPTEMAKISRDVAIGITKGKWPFRVAQPIIERWGLSPEEARKWLLASYYIEESPGIWRQGEIISGPSAGPGGGYAGGGVGRGRRGRGPSAISTRTGRGSLQMVSWRIGI